VTSTSGRGLMSGKVSTSGAAKAMSGESRHSSRALSHGEHRKVLLTTKDSSGLKAQGVHVAINHRRSLSLDMTLKSNVCSVLEASGFSGGSLDSQENSAMKRKRWV
jgi:hypothetical protein